MEDLDYVRFKRLVIYLLLILYVQYIYCGYATNNHQEPSREPAVMEPASI